MTDMAVSNSIHEMALDRLPKDIQIIIFHITCINLNPIMVAVLVNSNNLLQL